MSANDYVQISEHRNDYTPRREWTEEGRKEMARRMRQESKDLEASLPRYGPDYRLGCNRRFWEFL